MADRKVLCADQSGRTFLYDMDTRHVVTMPSLHKPNSHPFRCSSPAKSPTRTQTPTPTPTMNGIAETMSKTVSVASSSWKAHYTIDKEPSEQFEAYIYGQCSKFSLKAWEWELLPPPPYIGDPTKRNPLVSSYGVVGDGVSAEGAGTYLMDTVNHTW